ncbi:MAG: efflux RND transporter periplasmic adaptor subunit [Pseudomonadota bacterium]
MAQVKLVYNADRGWMIPITGEGVDSRLGGAQSRICYVDDSRTSTYVTTKVLKQYGYAVEHFERSDAALEVLLDQHFDLLLLDFAASGAEGLGGEHLIRIIRGSGHPRSAVLPIIVLVGNNDQAAVGQLKQSGANDVIMKPLKGKELDQVIRRLVANYHNHLGMAPAHKAAVTPAIDSANIKSSGGAASTRPKKVYSVLELQQRFGEIPTGKTQEHSAAPPTPETSPTSAAPAAPRSTQDVPILDNAVRGSEERGADITQTVPTLQTLATIVDARIVEKLSAAVAQKSEQLAVIDARGEVIHEAETKMLPLAKPAAQAQKNNTPVTDATTPLDSGLMALLEKLEHGQDRTAPNPFQSSYMPPKLDWMAPAKNVLSWKLIAIGVGIGVAIFGYQKWTTRESAAFNVVVAERGAIYESISVPAKVVSKRIAEITPYSAGQLIKIEVKEGDSVATGRVLAVLDDRDAQSNVKRTQATLLSMEEEVSRTNKNLQRLQRALELGAVSRQRVEDAEGEWRAATARQSITEEELRSTKLALERLQIVAPFDGVVTSIIANSGKWIAPPEIIMTVVDIAAQEVIAKVDAADAPAIQIGHEVMLSNESFAGKKWKEKVSRVAATTKKDNAPNSIDVVITLSASAPALRVGQQVDAEIRLRGKSDVVKIPVHALINKSGSPMVPVLQGDIVRLVPVVTGIEDITSVEIVRGIEDGEQIVITNGKEVNDGQHIRVLGNS